MNKLMQCVTLRKPFSRVNQNADEEVAELTKTYEIKEGQLVRENGQLTVLMQSNTFEGQIKNSKRYEWSNRKLGSKFKNEEAKNKKRSNSSHRENTPLNPKLPKHSKSPLEVEGQKQLQLKVIHC